MENNQISSSATRLFSSKAKRSLRFGEELGEIEQKYSWIKILNSGKEEIEVYKFRDSDKFWVVTDKKQNIFMQLRGRELISFGKFLGK